MAISTLYRGRLGRVISRVMEALASVLVRS